MKNNFTDVFLSPNDGKGNDLGSYTKPIVQKIEEIIFVEKEEEFPNIEYKGPDFDDIKSFLELVMNDEKYRINDEHSKVSEYNKLSEFQFDNLLSSLKEYLKMIYSGLYPFDQPIKKETNKFHFFNNYQYEDSNYMYELEFGNKLHSSLYLWKFSDHMPHWYPNLLHTNTFFKDKLKVGDVVVMEAFTSGIRPEYDITLPCYSETIEKKENSLSSDYFSLVKILSYEDYFKLIDAGKTELKIEEYFYLNDPVEGEWLRKLDESIFNDPIVEWRKNPDLKKLKKLKNEYKNKKKLISKLSKNKLIKYVGGLETFFKNEGIEFNYVMRNNVLITNLLNLLQSNKFLGFKESIEEKLQDGLVNQENVDDFLK